MGFWGKSCRFAFVDFIRRARNTRGKLSNGSAFFAAGIFHFADSCDATPGTWVAMTRFLPRKSENGYLGASCGSLARLFGVFLCNGFFQSSPSFLRRYGDNVEIGERVHDRNIFEGAWDDLPVDMGD